MFILRRKRSSQRRPGPGTEGLGGTLGGWWAAAPHPTCPSGSNCQEARGCAAPLQQGIYPLQHTPCPRGHPKTCWPLAGGGCAGWETYSQLLGCPGSSPVSQGKSWGFPAKSQLLPLPKANFFPTGDGSSEQHPGMAPPRHQHVPRARAGSVLKCGTGAAVSFLGRKSQIKEEGTSHNPSPCETAVASKAAHISR